MKIKFDRTMYDDAGENAQMEQLEASDEVTLQLLVETAPPFVIVEYDKETDTVHVIHPLMF